MKFKGVATAPTRAISAVAELFVYSERWQSVDRGGSGDTKAISQ